MRGTIIANYSHGAYCSGDRLLSRQQLFRQWLESRDDDFFSAITEEVFADRLVEYHPDESALLSVDDLLLTPGICKRGRFEACLWFGIPMSLQYL